MVDRTKEILDGAVATTKGWVNPTTGELLVSIRGLSDAIEWERGPITLAAKTVEVAKEEPVAEEAPKPKATKKTAKKTPAAE